jgi:prepilin peptidase CpaA
LPLIIDIHILVTLQKTIAFAAMALLIIAAYSDIRTFRIPNALAIGVAALGVARLVLLGDPISAIYAVGMLVLVFIIGFLLFSRGLIGGGDVKLLMATTLLIRYRDFLEFFVLMSVFGALLSVAVTVLHSVPLFAGPRMTASRLAVPYGVAIAAAGVVTLLLQPLLFRYAISFAPSFLW